MSDYVDEKCFTNCENGSIIKLLNCNLNFLFQKALEK